MPSRSATILTVTALIAPAAGCGHADVTLPGGKRSVVTGRIFGAGCPAQRQGQKQCGSWFAGTVRILRLSGARAAVAATTRCDQAGRFHVPLPPGRYAVDAVGLFNRLPDQTFIVRKGGPSVVLRLSISNGIE